MPAQSADLVRWATYASVATAATLIGVKLFAWLMTDSVSLLSTLVDSIIDAVASLLSLFAVRQALTPADNDHRFGHGKAEPLAALGQAAFITGSAVFLSFEALNQLVSPEQVANVPLGIGVMLFSIVTTGALVAFQGYVVRRSQSVVIRADSLHYMSDLLINGAVILALLGGALLGWDLLDPIFALLIAAYILKLAWAIAGESLHMLMDRELPDEERARIEAIARSHAEVLDVHDLRTRMAGPQMFIQLHLELDGGITLLEAHDIAERVERELQTAFPRAEIMIHQDPSGRFDPPKGLIGTAQ